MSGGERGSRSAGDLARVTVFVAVPPDVAFRVFSEEIDRWWLRGLRYRVFGKKRGIICLEPRLGGRLFESFEEDGQTSVLQTGSVTAWEPPGRLAFEWRASNFKPAESTLVDVRFEPSARGTQVTVTHSGWSRIRPDHPVRHGESPRRFYAAWACGGGIC